MGVSHSFAQEMFGAASSNYAGQMGMDLNPASIVNAPYRWELHLVSMDVSVLNNYMYLAKNSRLIRKSFKGESVAQERFTDKYTTKPNKWAYNSAFLKYPAFIYSGKKFALGFHISTREELSARNVPFHLAKFLKEGFDYDQQQGINYTMNKPSNTVLINWHELSFTGGAKLYDTPEAFITGALTVNYNYGLNAVYVQIKDLQYNSVADTLLVIDNIDLEYSHAVPDNGNNGVQKTLQKKGGGWSTSFGMEYYRNRNEAFYNPCRKKEGKPYDYKIGASIIDLGYMKFNKNARIYKFDNVNTDWYGIDTVKFDGFGSTDSILQQQFYGNYHGAKDGYGFKVFTPAAVSVQVDVPLNSFFYVNASVIQRLPLGPMAVSRSNQVAITPRLETRRLEIALPFSLYDYFRPRIGASIRYGVFTIGSDMLGPFVGLTDTYGADIYFAISIKHFPVCGREGRGKRPRLEQCKTPGKS